MSASCQLLSDRESLLALEGCCARVLIRSDIQAMASSQSQSVWDTVDETSGGSQQSLPLDGPLDDPTPLLPVQEAIIEPESKKTRRSLRCAPTLVDTDFDVDVVIANCPTEAPGPSVTAISPPGADEDSLIVLLETTMDASHERRRATNERERDIDACLARIQRDPPPELSEDSIRDEALAVYQMRELKAADDAIEVARASSIAHARTLAAARWRRESSLLEEVRLIGLQPGICMAQFKKIEGHAEEDSAVAMSTLRRIVGTVPASQRFYIGICASPVTRWLGSDEYAGHCHTFERMNVIGAFEAHRASQIEERAIDEFLGQSRCKNKRRGKGGRGPAGSLGFVYVCQGDE